MTGGIEGQLLSSAFIDERIDAAALASIHPVRLDLVRWRKACAMLGPASPPTTLLQSAAVPLMAILGLGPPAQIAAFDGGVSASLPAGTHAVALVVTGWAARLDPLWRLAVTEASGRGAAWCLLFNGLRLRVVDAHRLYARRHLDFDLDLVADQARTCAALWLTCGATALSSDPGDDRSLPALAALSDRHAAGVCRSLRDGVLTASNEVLQALVANRRNVALHDSLEQALTIVYRILFLLFAEARALVPLWHPVYRESYSLESLRDLSERPGPVRAPGLWEALRAIARLAHAGCRAGDLRVTAFNGRLFSPGRTPLAERRDLDDEAARRAVVALSTRSTPKGGGRERIAYRDLGVEQLGAVYETLLDYEPRLDRRRVTLERGSGVRKATGTFYTPQPIADYLARRTLAPLVRDAEPDAILQLRVVDPAMGSGAFLVAACRFLAAAYESALVRAGGYHPSDFDEAERVLIRRTIAERCLYGVDLNPMAVQLARLSLWLATLSADRPLSFLDHRLQVGDSLLGTWLSRLRRAPSPRRPDRGDKPLPLFDDQAASIALREALPIRFSLEGASDTIEQVRAKERAFATLTGRTAALSRWKQIAHLWCAAWFAPEGEAPPLSAFGSLCDAALAGRSSLPSNTTARYLDAASAIGDARRLFHWELEFPEVFFDADGRRRANAGFDAVIGNPPWEMMRADAGGIEARARARDAMAPVLRFTRDAGLYEAQSGGHANRYQLFVERAVSLTRSGGRLGLVLPSGLATDHGSAALRRLLLSRCDVDAIVSMDNRRGVFPIHRSVRFLLVTASFGSPTRQIACRLGLDDPAALEALADDEPVAAASFPVRLSPALLERISGPSLTIPNLSTPIDVAIVERAAALFPPLGHASGWAATFGRELNATDDCAVFRPGRHGLPIVDGKHLSPFSVDLDAVSRCLSAADARRLLPTDRHRRVRLAYRDVASATNRQTLIAAMLPAGCVSTHTVFCLRTPLPHAAQYFLCGLFNSFVVNYLVRLRVTTHVTTATVEQLPVPPAGTAPAACRHIAALARLLSRRPNAAASALLNAKVAALYQLTAGELEHVLGTFPLIPAEQRRTALRAFVDQEQ